MATPADSWERDAAGLVDFHVHLTSPAIKAQADRYADRDPYFSLLAHTPNNRYATAPELVADMEAHGVRQAVVFGFAFRDQGLCREANEYTLEAVRRYPQLVGFAVVNPRLEGAVAELERCRSLGLRGVGELFAYGQGFDPGDPHQMGPVAEACQEWGWPLILHLNEPVGHLYPGKVPTPLQAAVALAQAFPRLKLVLAHFGGGLLFYELMPELQQALKNVYYDTAAAPLLYRPAIYEAAAAAGVWEKLLFATDYPLVSWPRAVRHVQSAGLDADRQAQLFAANARRLLGTLPRESC
ncbi:MAG: amidohydrolase [Firmicutes bacterium]|nr:amidohydrolase [Bacillota bacterium]